MPPLDPADAANRPEGFAPPEARPTPAAPPAERLDQETLKRCLFFCGDAYDRKINAAVPDIFWGVLKDFPDGEVRRAFETHLAGSVFFPRPADVVAIIDGGDRSALAALAWPKVKMTYDEVNAEMLIPDGAAAEAMGDMDLAGLPPSKVCRNVEEAERRNFYFDFFQAAYSVHHRNGLHRRPGVFVGGIERRNGRDPEIRRFAPSWWWTPAMRARHGESLRLFALADRPDGTPPVPQGPPPPVQGW